MKDIGKDSLWGLTKKHNPGFFFFKSNNNYYINFIYKCKLHANDMETVPVLC